MIRFLGIVWIRSDVWMHRFGVGGLVVVWGGWVAAVFGLSGLYLVGFAGLKMCCWAVAWGVF